MIFYLLYANDEGAIAAQQALSEALILQSCRDHSQNVERETVATPFHINRWWILC